MPMLVSPEARFQYTSPYKTQIPGDLVPDNPYFDSLVHESTSHLESASTVQGSSASSTLFAKQHAPRLNVDIFQQYQSMYLHPFHAADLVEPRLSTANVSAWTSVCDDNALMRNLLASFFRCEYQFTAAFQKDLFLEDLVAGRQDFCSSLLVNIVFGYSCV